jgi:hypothetical protein
VIEIEPTRPSGGAIVWEWRAQDHLIQDAGRAKPNFGVVADTPCASTSTPITATNAG